VDLAPDDEQPRLLHALNFRARTSEKGRELSVGERNAPPAKLAAARRQSLLLDENPRTTSTSRTQRAWRSIQSIGRLRVVVAPTAGSSTACHEHPRVPEDDGAVTWF
jgi:hypothetical protein